MNLKENLSQYSYLSKITEVAALRNEQVYLVGGFVRDIFIGRLKKEMDFLIVGDGPAFAKKLAENLGINEIVIFKNFGTAHFDYNGMALEFVGARKESYNKKSRNPIVTSGSLDDDLNRRDFTVNTLAVSMNKDDFGEIVYFFF